MLRSNLIRRALPSPSASLSTRNISTTRPIFAAAAAASSTSTSSATAKPRTYTKRIQTPAPSSSSSAFTPSTNRSASALASRAPASRDAPKAAVTPKAVELDSWEGIEENEEDQHYTLPEISSGISDYASLASPSATAIVKRARAPQTEDLPTPSPPMTQLPSGISTLPMIDIQGELPVGNSGSLGDQVSDWSTSFAGLGSAPFPKEVGKALLRPLEPADVEVKPDGLLYLPEIKYRRTLNAAFGPGGWGLAPRGETNVGPRIVSREWGLVALGRLVSVARGEQEYFDPSGVPTATEACKSNALMRCCKDLGIASELWDPRFIREFKVKYCAEVFTEHQGTKRKKKMWRKKDGKFEYPYKET